MASSNATILSCVELGCPVQNTTTHCTVTNQTFPVVGAAPITGFPSSPNLVSWVEGVSVTDSGSQRFFDKTFYLGNLETLTGSTGSNNSRAACALFFTHVSSRVTFGSDVNPETAQGTCSDAMGRDCVSAMIARANAVKVAGLQPAQACEALQKDFQSNVDGACQSAADAISGWIDVRAVALPSTAHTITARENSTSNCWPVAPKSASLSAVTTFSTTSDMTTSALTQNFFNITPILTVVLPDGTSGSQSASYLTCMKGMGLNSATNATQKTSQATSFTRGGLGGNAGWLVLGMTLLFLVC